MLCVSGINTLIKKTAFAAENKPVDSKRKILQFVNVKINDSTTEAAATDGSFIAVSNASLGSGGNLDLVIHEKAIKTLSEVVSADETIFVGTADNYAVFLKEDMLFHTLMPTEKYLDVGATMSKIKPECKLLADTAMLKRLILEVLCLLREGDDRCINLSADINMLKAYCVTALGQSNASLQVVCNTPTPSEGFNYNPNILLECLSRTNGPVEVYFDRRGFMIMVSNQSRYLICPRGSAQIRVKEEKPKKETVAKKDKS